MGNLYDDDENQSLMLAMNDEPQLLAMNDDSLMSDATPDLGLGQGTPDVPAVVPSDDVLKTYFANQAKMRDDLTKAESRADQGRFYAQLGGALNTISAGAANKKADNSFYEQLANDSDRIVDRTMKQQALAQKGDSVLANYFAKKNQVEQQNARQDKQLAAKSETDKAKIDAFNRRTDALAKAGAKKGSVGQQSLDRTFGKEYDEWTSGGSLSVDKNLDKLNGVLGVLQNAGKNSNISGRFVGRAPDIMRSEQSIALRDDVRSAVMDTLKATLGAQFTEKEGERIFNLAYNDKLSPEANIPRLQRQIQYLTGLKANKEAKARYFENNNGSLQGYKPSPVSTGSTQTAAGDGNSATTPKTTVPAGKVRVIKKSTGKAGFIPASQLREALDSGEYTQG